MKLYIVAPDTDTHLTWVNNQPRPDDPTIWDGPITPVPIMQGVVGTWRAPLAKSDGFTQTLDFVLSVSHDLPISVAAGLIVEWIMSNFAGRAKKVIIERMEVTFDRGELTKIVTETIKSERD